MKLHKELLFEETHTLVGSVNSLDDLIDPTTGKYYTGIVNVTSIIVDLTGNKLKKIPVQFGKTNSFYCSSNELTSLEGSPRESGHFYCRKNKLTSLEHAPAIVNGEFACSHNQITSLEGIHKIIKKMKGGFYFIGNPVKSGGIGLLLIEGITEINSNSNLPAFHIISKYLGQGKAGLLRCQEELIEAGLEEYAKL